MDEIKIAIPATGRMAEESLEQLAVRGVVEKEWASNVAVAVRSTKKNSSEEAVMRSLLQKWESGLEGVTLKYDLRSGWRLAFSAKAVNVEGVQAIVYGSEAPTITGIRQGLAEIAIIGFDDLLAAMVPYLDPSTPVRRWDEMNKAVYPKNSTDVRVIGSAGLEDYAGLFLLAAEELDIKQDYIEIVRTGKKPLYVKGRNEGLAYYLLGNDIDARATEDIEDAVKSDKCFGLDIVRSGNTVLENQLKAIGNPLLCSMAVIAVDMAKYRNNRDVFYVLRKISGYVTDIDYAYGIPKWESQLEQRLASSWVR